MDIVMSSHRFGQNVLEKEFPAEWTELKQVLNGISDEDIIAEFNSTPEKSKSISDAINTLIDQRLTEKGWLRQAAIFHSDTYNLRGSRWRLDFAKSDISVEVAFNHGEATAWNLIKPVLASELNHVQKEIQTKVGVVIFATNKMKKAGGFDSSVGSYEKALTYLAAMNTILTTPIVIIGLTAPDTFLIEQTRGKNNRRVGKIVRVVSTGPEKSGSFASAH